MDLKAKNIRVFLQSRGWAEGKENEKYHFLSPPEHIKFDYEFYYNIPKYEEGKDTPEYLLRLTSSIAEMYEIDKYDLMALLSKKEKELEKEIEKQKKELELKESYYKAMVQEATL